MGIRFYCPNGHKLNVKEFQAGRRGICPFCGARILIPTQSTRPSTKSAKSKKGPKTAGQPQTEGDADQASDSSPDVLPGEPPGMPARPGATAGAGPNAAPPVIGGGAVRQTFAPAASPAPAPVAPAATPVAATPVATTPIRLTVEPRAAGAAPAPPNITVWDGTPDVGSQGPTPPAPPEPGGDTAADPISEAPEMIWYVRPSSGGQFGPAAGENMRSWLAEGRVSADSLVWREGWRDWQEAGAVFPQLRGSSVMDFLESTPIVPTTPLPTSHHHHAPAQSDRTQTTILIVLGLAVVVLIAVFLWILFRPS